MKAFPAPRFCGGDVLSIYIISRHAGDRKLAHAKKSSITLTCYNSATNAFMRNPPHDNISKTLSAFN